MKTFDSEKNFFGRKPTLDLLKRRVIDLKEGYRQNIAFLGSRYTGKSSILRQFLSDLDDEQVIPVYLDLDNKDFRYFCAKFSGSILYHYLKVQNLPVYEDRKLLQESSKKLIPQTVEAIKKIENLILKEKWLEAYRDIIALPEIFTNESNKFCVIIIDEFHNLEDFEVNDVFKELGKKIMTQKRCIYLVTSSLPSVAKKILSEKLSLLFGNFEIVPIMPFDLKTSQDYIDHHLQGVNIGGQFKNFLTDFTGGHPLYLSLICQELVNLCAVHEQHWVFMPLVIEAIENCIFNKWGILSRHFELSIDTLVQSKGQQTMASVLIALANGKHKLSEIANQTGLKQSGVLLKLNRLIEAGLVNKNGNFFLLEDKLLKYWIKYVFEKRLKSVEPFPERQRKEFREEVTRSLMHFNQISREDLSSRIVELLQCFDNEAFQLNGRKYKLPSFREIVPLKLRDLNGSYFDVIKACCEEGVWLIVLKTDNLYENDLNSFLVELKKFEQKPQKRLIISMAELDDNARLKALQERMWIWNEYEINSLLNIYDKPYIVK